MLLALLFALAGWQARIHFTHDPPRRSGGSDGVIHVAGTRVRIDEPTSAGLTVILSVGGKVRLLFPERKQFMEVSAEEAPLAAAPPLSLMGLARVGDESIGGRACAIWERTIATPMGKVRQRIWVLEGARRFQFLRFVTQTERGATWANVSEIEERAQPAALFRVPRDYVKK